MRRVPRQIRRWMRKAEQEGPLREDLRYGIEWLPRLVCELRHGFPRLPHNQEDQERVRQDWFRPVQ